MVKISQMSGEQKRKEAMRIVWIAFAGLMYAFFMNLFIIPAGMYSGGFMGLSQITRTLVIDYGGVNLGTIDFAGIINFAFNVPLFIVARKTVGYMYLLRTIVSLAFESFFLTLIPAIEVGIIDDPLTAIVIGGIGTGISGGILLRNGACGGGTELLGAVLIHKIQNLKISVVANIFNIVVYGIMLIMFDIPRVVYSAIYSVIYNIAQDRVFSQNINVEAHIITSKDFVEPMQDAILKNINRGVTKWNAIGAYTGNEKEVLYVLVSKYELTKLVSTVHSIDERALIVENIGVRINGNFEKRVT